MKTAVARPAIDPGGSRIPKAIAWGGLICGCLDITAACIDAKLSFGFGPVRLLQGVAGAVLGPAALEGGLATAALGLAMHFSVAFTWTAIFYFLSRRFPVLVKWAVPAGLVYGAVVFIAMFRGVIPVMIELKSLYLTNVSHTLPQLRPAQFVIHLVCIGLAIALTIRRFAPVPDLTPKLAAG